MSAQAKVSADRLYLQNDCPSADVEAYEAHTFLEDTLAPRVLARLRDDAPGAPLIARDLVSFMQLCAIESLADGKLSPWCDGVFDRDNWRDVEYVDLHRHCHLSLM